MSTLNVDTLNDANGTLKGIPVFTVSFESAEQTCTSGGALTLAHSMSSAPKVIQAFLINKTAELGYSIGDIVQINPSTNSSDGISGRGISLVSDATNVVVRFGSSSAFTQVNNKSTGTSSGITNGSWKLIVRAYT